MFSIATKPINEWIGGGGGETVAEGSSVDRIFLSVLLIWGLLILSKRKVNWSGVMRENAWLMLLIGYMLVSILWSDMQFISFKRWVRELTAVVMALVVMTEQDPRLAMQILLKRTVYILIPFSLLLIKYFPLYGVQFASWSGERMWVGVTLQKNALGRLCIISAFFLIWTLVRRWQGRDKPVGKHQTKAEVLLLFITFWLLRGPSQYAASATAIVALTLGLATFLGLLWMKKNRIQPGAGTWVAIIACIIGLGIITPLVGGSSVSAFTSMVGRDATLTGRTEIWAGLLPVAARRPILGSGYGALWTLDTIIAATGVSEAHNGYLEVLLQLGLVGLFITGMFLLSCVRKAHRTLQNDFDWGCLCMCFILMTVVHNITESSIDSFTRHLMANVLFLTITAPVVALTEPQECSDDGLAKAPEAPIPFSGVAG